MWKKSMVLAVVLAATGCAHARHVSVVTDAAFAQAVFALDDQETAACAQAVLTPAQCVAANPKIKQALIDVKAVTQAIQATPKNVTVPKALPDLLTDLTQIQAILGPVANVPQAAGVVAQSTAALNQALSLLRLYAQFTGGQ